MNQSEDNYDNNNTKFTSKRKYKDIIEGRFDIANVIYIDRKDDGNTIFGKAAEFSTKTINKLREDGRLEALNELKNIYLIFDNVTLFHYNLLFILENKKIKKYIPEKACLILVDIVTTLSFFL